MNNPPMPPSCETLEQLLRAVQDGTVPVAEAAARLKTAHIDDLGFANVDLHRRVRQGVAEVVYGAGKTPEQISAIAASLVAHGQPHVLITRIGRAAADDVAKTHPTLRYNAQARIAALGPAPPPSGTGVVAVLTGGTSDIPVAEEAAVTAEELGNSVQRIYDVGVAGLHRLLSRARDIASASVVIAVAGMEGALASVVGGLADCPVIAVPTSVGYGASFGGLSALLAMVNSCSAGTAVVNIDNGFGAGFLAHKINHPRVP
jgi:NCAIR mutase (PurE)-related protein